MGPSVWPAATATAVVAEAEQVAVQSVVLAELVEVSVERVAAERAAVVVPVVSAASEEESVEPVAARLAGPARSAAVPAGAVARRKRAGAEPISGRRLRGLSALEALVLPAVVPVAVATGTAGLVGQAAVLPGPP